MPPKPAYAVPKPKAVAAGGEDRRGFLGLMFGSALALGFTAVSLTTGIWTLLTARFMFPNILTEPPSSFKVGFQSIFGAGAGGRRNTRPNSASGCATTNTRGRRKSTLCGRFARISAARPIGSKESRNSSVPATAAATTKTASTSKAPRRDPLNATRSKSADDGQLEIDKSKLFQEEIGQWTDPASFVPV